MLRKPDSQGKIAKQQPALTEAVDSPIRQSIFSKTVVHHADIDRPLRRRHCHNNKNNYWAMNQSILCSIVLFCLFIRLFIRLFVKENPTNL